MYQQQVSFGEAINIAFTKYCCFTGRASRSEFWWFMLFCILISAVCTWLSYMVGEWITYVATIALFLPQLGLSWRRLHDIGKGGGWYFLGLIPLVGQIILIVWYCCESEMYPNRFGDVPNLTVA